ncbi:MAG: hypothetical protein BGO69_06700 [Bacteroidetes bacterium 46-16]|nr:MAG: hypothetical protein BGO69_06700 [Bacteroidetes bacterium 46-16]
MKSFTISMLSAVTLLWASSCKRDKYYRCECQSSDSTALYEIGRSDADHAYALCRSNEDSSTSCIMWVMK